MPGISYEKDFSFAGYYYFSWFKVNQLCVYFEFNHCQFHQDCVKCHFASIYFLLKCTANYVVNLMK